MRMSDGMKRILTVLLIGVLTLSFSVYAADTSVTIASEEDFRSFARMCTLDSWSKGKHIYLTKDIRFSEDISPVPVFCGYFHGNGHTLSGIRLSANGSDTGVFRYLNEGGTIESVTVSAKILPGGTKSRVGGIVGVNRGTVETCTFTGTVRGSSYVGGIAGVNGQTGTITSCRAAGIVEGADTVGGIAGKNDGCITNCENRAAVDTAAEIEKAGEETELGSDISTAIENLSMENGEERIRKSDRTDIGGIVGRQSGILQGCKNYGTVGYPHIGYNVGGIAGRQSGYLIGCENHGDVRGRKDVGGIVGQAEPYVLLETSESLLTALQKETDRLHAMTEGMILDMDAADSQIGSHLTVLSGMATDARGYAGDMLSGSEGYVNGEIANINACTARLSDTVRKIVPAMAAIADAASGIGQSVMTLKTTLDEFSLERPDDHGATDEVKAALDEIGDAMTDLGECATDLKKALNQLDSAITVSNQRKVKRAFYDVADEIEALASAKDAIKSALKKLRNVLNTKPESFKDIGLSGKKAKEYLALLAEGVEDMDRALSALGDDLVTIIENTELSFDAFQNASDYAAAATDCLADAVGKIDSGIGGMKRAVTGYEEGAEEFLTEAENELDGAKKGVYDALSTLEFSVGQIADALTDLYDVTKEFASEEPLTISVIPQEVHDAGESLMDSLGDMAGELSALRETAARYSDKTIGNLEALNTQFTAIINLIIREFDLYEKRALSVEDCITDVSYEDIGSVRQGKIDSCENTAKIEGDRNTGGIAGALSVDYGSDPEDDFKKPTSLYFTYRTKAVIEDCENRGDVTGRKDCVGGVVGNMALGTVYGCGNFGTVTSQSGAYTGGIAGYADSAIRNSYAKCAVSGESYVGGIAGYASLVRDSYTIVRVTGDESVGAILGKSGKNASVTGNRYVDGGVGAIDSVSYESSAAPISYEDLAKEKDLPREFTKFSVTFKAGEVTVASVLAEYGEAASAIPLPALPEKAGTYGAWESFPEDRIIGDVTIRAIYTPYLSALESEETDGTGKPLALAEGTFTGADELHMVKDGKTPAPKAGGTVWNLRLSAEIGEERSYRLYAPERTEVLRLSDTGWERLPVSRRGSYLSFRSDEDELTLFIRRGMPAALLWLIPVIAVLLAAGLFVFIRNVKKKH